MSDDRTKFCPFCGSTDADPEDFGTNGEGAIRCQNCGAYGPTARNPDGVAKSWALWDGRHDQFAAASDELDRLTKGDRT